MKIKPYLLKSIAIVMLLFALYVSAYLSLREIEVNEISVKVIYSQFGYREYILDNPQIDSKLESGTYDYDKSRSWILRLFIPIERIEIKNKFKLKHY